MRRKNSPSCSTTKKKRADAWNMLAWSSKARSRPWCFYMRSTAPPNFLPLSLSLHLFSKACHTLHFHCISCWPSHKFPPPCNLTLSQWKQTKRTRKIIWQLPCAMSWLFSWNEKVIWVRPSYIWKSVQRNYYFKISTFHLVPILKWFRKKSIGRLLRVLRWQHYPPCSEH